MTIWAFVSLGKNVLSASRIFTAIALFNQLRFPLLFYPMVIAAVAEGRVALRRLQGTGRADTGRLGNLIRSPYVGLTLFCPCVVCVCMCVCRVLGWGGGGEHCP